MRCLAAGAWLAAHQGAGFSGALAGAGPVFIAVLIPHVLAGLTAVVSGAVAATAPKRRGRHSRSGTIYYWAITVVSVTAAGLAAIRPARDLYLFLLGALAFTLATAGRQARRHPAAPPWRRWPGHWFHITAMAGSYTVLLTAFYLDNGKNLPLWDRLPEVAYWVLPAAVAAPLVARALVCYRLPGRSSRQAQP